MVEIFGFRVIDNLPALYSEELDTAVISDLHLGLEGSITYDGGYIPKFQLEEIKDDIRKISDETGAETVLVNGDLKHEFNRTSFSEKKEIEEFLDLLEKEFEEVILVEGNHDTFVSNLTATRKTVLKEYHLEKDVLFIHGHEMPPEDLEFDTLVIGHEHPALQLTDEVGVKEKVDCFLYGETSLGNLIILPAFSRISGGSKVNRVPGENLLSPVLRKVDRDSLEAVAVSREAGVFEFPEIGKI